MRANSNVRKPVVDVPPGTATEHPPPPDQASLHSSSRGTPALRSGGGGSAQDLKAQGLGAPRPQTSHNASSRTQSPSGSPPIPTDATSATAQEYPFHTRPQQAGPTSQPQAPTLPPYQPSHMRGSMRSASVSGGVQVVLNDTGSWSGMANQSQGLVGGNNNNNESERPRASGMLGFLGRKKGRDRSPRAKERERGVLGKEGARVVVGH